MSTAFRTWADVLAEQAVGPSGGLRLLVAESAETEPEAAPVRAVPVVDRAAGDGPPRCCRRRRIAADMLVWYGGLSDDALARLREALPHLANVPRDDLYLCDGCRDGLLRDGILSPEEVPRQW